MRIGFHTNAYVWSGLAYIERIARNAIEDGFDCIELGPGIPLEREIFSRVTKEIPVAAMIYCRNFIDDDTEAAMREQAELFRRMEFASDLGARKMICSTGISRRLSIPDSGGCDPTKSLEPVLEFLHRAVCRAKELGLVLCLENCPMYRNIATSPYLWKVIFDNIPDPALGLCYDASHFVWQFIDVYGPMEEYRDRIHHVHLKDTRLYPEKLQRIGILHNTARERGFDENQWWRHTILGNGEINWHRFMEIVKTLPSPLLDLSFEQEDCCFESDPQNVRRGLEIQLRRLNTYL